MFFHKSISFCLQFHDKKFCANSSKARQELGEELLEQLQGVAGTERLDITTTREQINRCIVTGCGGCSGSGIKILRERFLVKTVLLFEDVIEHGKRTPQSLDFVIIC